MIVPCNDRSGFLERRLNKIIRATVLAVGFGTFIRLRFKIPDVNRAHKQCPLNETINRFIHTTFRFINQLSINKRWKRGTGEAASTSNSDVRHNGRRFFLLFNLDIYSKEKLHYTEFINKKQVSYLWTASATWIYLNGLFCSHFVVAINLARYPAKLNTK